jgi:hypothetical protein
MSRIIQTSLSTSMDAFRNGFHRPQPPLVSCIRHTFSEQLDSLLVMQKLELNTLTALLEGSRESGSSGGIEARTKTERYDYDKHHGTMVKWLIQSIEEETKMKVPVHKAIEMFEKEVPDVEGNPDLYCLATHTLKLAKDGRCTIRRPVRGGTPGKLTEHQADRAMRIFLDGNGCKPERWWGFTSISHALANSSRLVAIMEEAGVTEGTLFRRIQERYKEVHGRAMQKISTISKPLLRADVTVERYRKAKEWRKWGKKSCLMWCGLMRSKSICATDKYINDISSLPHGTGSMFRASKEEL